MRKTLKLNIFILLVALLCSGVGAEAVESAREEERQELPQNPQEQKTQIQKQQKSPALIYYQRAKKSLRDGNCSRAIKRFKKVIELEKQSQPVYTPYAQEYIQWTEEIIRQQQKRPKKTKAKRTVQPKDVIQEGPPTLEYTIGVADVLYIQVWREESLSQEVIVRPDGKISFHFAGDIPAAGLTFNQLRAGLTQRLKEYIKHPVVSISLKRLGGNKVIVLGEVEGPGVYPVTGKNTVLEAIAQAGGFTDDAVVSSVILIRGGLENPKGIRLNLSRAIKKAQMSQNVSLQAEDIVYVPKSFIANVNYVLSQIVEPLSHGGGAALDFKDLQKWRRD